jgi:hypothetical protein
METHLLLLLPAPTLLLLPLTPLLPPPFHFVPLLSLSFLLFSAGADPVLVLVLLSVVTVSGPFDSASYVIGCLVISIF